MPLKKISDFTAGTPAGDDKILYENNGDGKSSPISSLPVAWNSITGKPSSYNPLSHNHDERYYNKDETLLNAYPVGSIYLTYGTNVTGTSSPAQFFGGTWERLPEGYALWTASSGAGETIPAGLPNIKGIFHYASPQSGASSTSGAISAEGSKWIGAAGTAADIYWNIANFDANKGAVASGIYRDDCDTVQPKAYKVYAWKRVS